MPEGTRLRRLASAQVRHEQFILDALAERLDSAAATLVVLGSVSLTTASVEAFMTSMTLAVMRRFALPLLLLTINARAVTLPLKGVCAGEGRV